MADTAPELSPISASHDSSTLEAVSPTSPNHPTLELAHPERDDTLEYKEVYAAVDPTPPDVEARPVDGRSKKRRVCGMGLKTAIAVAVVLLLVIAGAVVGGVLGSRKTHKKSHEATAAHISSSPTTTTTATPTKTGTIQDYFENDKWYNFTNIQIYADHTPFTLQANWYPDYGIANITIDNNHSLTHQKQFQIRSVPRGWANSTYSPEGWDDQATLYWICSRQYGPEICLTLGLNDWTTVQAEGLHTATVRPQPMDQGDEGQMWFFQKFVNGTTYFNIHNLRSALNYTLVYNDNWRSGTPSLNSFWPAEYLGDQWMVEEVAGMIDENDGGYTWIIVDDV